MTERAAKRARGATCYKKKKKCKDNFLKVGTHSPQGLIATTGHRVTNKKKKIKNI